MLGKEIPAKYLKVATAYVVQVLTCVCVHACVERARKRQRERERGNLVQAIRVH